MTLEKITAKFSCDGCGATLTAEIEPTWGTKVYGDDGTAFDLAEDALKGGCGPGLALASAEDGKHLCPLCTEKAFEAALANDRESIALGDYRYHTPKA